MQNALRSVQADPVDGIVIDLRENHGGATQAAVHLLAPFTRQRVKLTRQKSWKISDTYKAHLRRQGLDGSGYLRARSGKVIDIEYDAEALPEARYRFDGPVSMVVGARTFSSAVKLADAAQHYGIATIIGSETGGRPSSFGEGYRFRLPNSNLQAMASTAYFVRLNGRESDRGVIPDVVVPDVTVGTTDLALQTAIQRTN
jgi:C-terminal processing protease CtpA/Prc